MREVLLELILLLFEYLLAYVLPDFFLRICVHGLQSIHVASKLLRDFSAYVLYVVSLVVQCNEAFSESFGSPFGGLFSGF